MKKSLSIFLSLLAFIWILGCEQEVVEVPPRPDNPALQDPATTSGAADFSTFVVVGNSLSAGFQSAALFTAGQNNSMPAIIARQMGSLTGSFSQPDIASTNGYNLLLSNPPDLILGRLILAIEDGETTVIPTGTPNLPPPLNTADFPSPYTGNIATLNNFAVPQLAMVTAGNPGVGDPGSPLYNPYYARFASNPGGSTPLGDAIARNGTFFLFWLGANDVLNYAFTGASNPAVRIDVATFELAFNANIAAMMSSNSGNIKGVVGNVPDILLTPFFNLVPYNSIPLDAATAAVLNTSFASYNGGIAFALADGQIDQAEADLREIVWTASATNAILIEDETLTNVSVPDGQGGSVPLPNIRQATPDDFILFTAQPILGTLADPGNPTSAIGIAVPLGDQYVLIPDESNDVRGLINGYNAAIENGISAGGFSDDIALADAFTILQQFAVQGEFSDTSPSGGANLVRKLTYSIEPPNGAWSLDGLHLSSRGSAWAANFFIDAINEKFGSDIPHANWGSFPSNDFPITLE